MRITIAELLGLCSFRSRKNNVSSSTVLGRAISPVARSVSKLVSIESLEGRRLFAVSGLEVTSLTSTADTDGSASNQRVTVAAGATVTAAIRYNSTAADPTTAKLDIGSTGTSFITVPSGNQATASLSLTIPVGTPAGSYNAFIQVRNGNTAAENLPNVVTIAVPVTVIDTTVSISAPTVTYGDAGLVTVSVAPVAATGSASLSVDGGAASSRPLSAGSATFDLGRLNAGTYALSADYTSDSSSYQNDGPVAGSLVVLRAASAVSVTGGVFTYDGTAHGAVSTAVTGAGGLSTTADALAYFDAQGNPLAGAPVDAGTYTVVASFAGGPNHLPSVSEPATITINKADAVINVSGYTGTYDGLAHGLTGTAVGVLGENLAALLNLGATQTDAGSYATSWSFAGNQNYNAASGSATVTINRADAILNVSGYTGTYDGQAHGLTGSATGVLGEDLAALLNLGATQTNAGSYATSWSFAGNQNYNPASGSATISIAKANALISVSGYTGTYDGLAHGLTGTASGVLGEDLGTLLNLGTAQTNAGSYATAWSFAGNQNYNAASGTRNIVISAREVLVDGSTQASINVAKAGVISFTLSNASGLAASDTLAVFNRATFHLRVNNTDYSVASAASFVNGSLVIEWRMTAELQASLLAAITSTTTASAKSLTSFIVSGTSANGNYFISEQVFSKLFSSGKLTF